MKYLLSSQMIPNKGISHTMYEVEDNDTILRMLTHIPKTNELYLYQKPVVKKLYKPELCMEMEPDEFFKLWERGEANQK